MVLSAPSRWSQFSHWALVNSLVPFSFQLPRFCYSGRLSSSLSSCYFNVFVFFFLKNIFFTGVLGGNDTYVLSTILKGNFFLTWVFTGLGHASLPDSVYELETLSFRTSSLAVFCDLVNVSCCSLPLCLWER